MNNHVDLSLHSYSRRLHYVHDPDYDVFAFIAEAARRGFNGVNISLSGPDNALLPPHRHLSGDTPAHVAAVSRRLGEHRLSVEIDTDTVEPQRLQASIQLARNLGARVLRTFTHHTGPHALSATIDDLKRSHRAAENADVVIAVENHEEFTSDELVRLVEDIDSSHVRLLFDYGNSLPVLEEPVTALATMLPHVVAAHLKDVAMVAAHNSPDDIPAAMGVPLGSGHLPLEDLTRTLISSGLTRLALQNVWGYHVPLGKLRPVDLDDTQLGNGTFAYLRPPWTDQTVSFHPEEHHGSAALLALEDHALDQATAHAFDLVNNVANALTSGGR